MSDQSESISSLLAAWPARMSDTVSRYVSLFAPNVLSQPILPGWNVGNTYIVSEFNSRNPGTERRILAEHSYGRQIGRIMEALTVLVGERDDRHTNRALKNFVELARKIDEIKQDSVEHRVARLSTDLSTLKNDKPDAYANLIRQLAAELADNA